MKRFSKKNGYYKYYNKEGKWCRIKIKDSSCVGNTGRKEVLLKFQGPMDDGWLITTIDKEFDNVFDIIHYLCKNLETNGTVFKVELK